jgi:hypothetical protein
MPIYRVKTPDGKTYRINGPAGASREEVISAVQSSLDRQLAKQTEAPEEEYLFPKEAGTWAQLKRGAKEMISSMQTAGEAITGSPEEAAKRGLERGKEIESQYEGGPSLERLKQAYEERGVLGAGKELIGSIPEALAGQGANIGTAIAGARLGAMAGAPLGPVGVGGGAIAGALIPSFAQQFGGDIERQAQEQAAAKQEIKIDRGRAATAAALQAPLDVAAEAIPLGRTVLGTLLGKEVKQLLAKGEAKALAQAEKLAEERVATTLAKGTAIGAATEIPTEIGQQMLERWQAGLSLTDDDALREYGETAYQVALLGPIGAVGRVAERSAARRELEQRPAEAEPEAAPQEPLALPAPRTGGYRVDSAGNVVPMTEAEVEADARLGKESRAMGLGEAEEIAARMQGRREEDFIKAMPDRFRAAQEAEDAALAAKDDRGYLYSLPMQQMEMPLVGGQAQPDFFTPTETTEPPPSMYRPAEESLAGLRPRSREYKEKAKELGLRLDKKGNIRPNQFVYQPQPVEVSPGQERFEFENQKQLPLMQPAPLEGQGDLFAQEPIQQGPSVPFTQQEPTGNSQVSWLPPQEAPQVEAAPGEQFALNLPGTPMASLTPRDRVLRAMAISEDRKTVDNLKFATGLRPVELKTVLADLKNEGAIKYRPGKFEWELTPAGEERVRGTRKGIGSARVGRRVPVSVQPTGPETSKTARTRKRPVAPNVVPAEGTSEGEGTGDTKLTPAPQSPIAQARTAAADAFDQDRINEATYEKVMQELKRPAPNMALVNELLTAAPKPKKKAAPAAVVPKMELREDATDEEIAEYFNKSKTRDKILGVKETPKLRKFKSEKRVAEEEEQAQEQQKQRDEVVTFEDINADLRQREIDNGRNKVHPDWAVKHEAPTNGRVVFSNDDVALLRGFNDKYSLPVYLGIDRKTGARTRIDISSFKGDWISPENKSILEDAKFVETTYQEQRQKDAPAGPFTGATSNVVASEGINPNYANFLSSLMKSMGLGDINVFLIHPEDVVRQEEKYNLYGDYQGAMATGFNPNENGSVNTFGPNRRDFFISIRPGMSEGKTVETIAHELGHLIERVAYNDAPAEVQKAIQVEFEQWLKDSKGKNAIELIQSLRNRETAEATVAQVSATTKLDDRYWRSFTEWFADNVSKWATTNKKPVGIIEKFFADLARKLRELVGKLTGTSFAPAKAVSDFLDNMGPGSIEGWVNKRGLSTTGVSSAYDPFDDVVRYSMSPTEQRAADRGFIDSIGAIPQALPRATKETIQEARNAASNVPGEMRRGLYSTLTVHQLAEMYRTVNGVKVTAALDNLWTDLNREGVVLHEREKEITDNLEKWDKIMSRYSDAERKRIYKIMLDTTVEQVEVLDLKDANRKVEWKANKASPLYRQFMSLKPEVREMYKQLRLTYLDYALGVEQQLKQYMTPTAWQKFQNEINKKRLPVYLPLFRSGEYKLTYTDKNGEYVSRRFESEGERSAASAEAKKQGATNIQSPLEDNFNEQNIPPTSFFGEIVGALRKNKAVPESVVQQVFDLYMDYLPVNSVLQLGRKREGTAGYEVDVLRGYANVAPSYARRLTNLEYTPKFQESEIQFRADMQSAVEKNLLDSSVANDLLTNISKQMDYIRDPKLNNFASKVAYFSYTMYLGGNISTAAINVTDIPTVVYSALGGKHGWDKAFGALWRAGKVFFSKKPDPEMQRVIDRGMKSGVIRTQQLQDIANFKKYGTNLDTLKIRTERVVNWAFAKSDTFNRETALLASYELNKEKLKSKFSGTALEDAAFKEAERDVYNAFGSSFPKAAPPLMGNGLAKTALTFKRFSLNRMWMLYKAYKEAAKGESPEVRKAARRELLGYFGTAYVFAGVQGMPLVGAGMTLAGLLNSAFGDDDEPYDLDEEMKKAIGLFNTKGPLNAALNVDFASRTGWTGMFWRDDPKRMAEVGPVTYTMEQLLGPAYSYAVGVPRAWDQLERGNYARAFEQMSPRAVGNISKGIRYATEGALTPDGTPLVDDVNAYNAFMQVFGFRPADVAEAGEEAGAAKGIEQKLRDRRNALIARAAMARMVGDTEGYLEAREEALEFSQKVPTARITDQTIIDAVKRREKKMRDSVNGVTVSKALAPNVYPKVYSEDED